MKKNNNKSVISKSDLQSGIKILAITLPLLFISPIVVTIGFKAVNKSDSYFILILGCILIIITILLMVQGFRKILKSLFARND